MSVVCLGEALVDLIAEPREDPRAPERFEARFGGALANVAVALARAGAPATLAGSTGTDAFGRFLRSRLEREGVDLRLHSQRDDLVTPFAFVRLDAAREPEFRIHGDGIEEGLRPWAGREAELLRGAEALVVGSNTLSAEPGRATTYAAVETARVGGIPVFFDPNLRLHRWPSIEAALEACRPVIAAATLVKASVEEARLLAGSAATASADPAGLAEAIAVPERIVVVTAGAAGAVARGAAGAEVAAPEVCDPMPLGAGDASMGALVAGLRAGRWRPEAVPAALEAAVAAGSDACLHPGAID